MKTRHRLPSLLLLAVVTAMAGCDSSSANKTSPVTVGPGSTPSTGTGSTGGTGGTGSTGGTGTGTGTLPGTGTVIVVNSLPNAVADVAVVQIGSTGNPINVLGNDSDANGDSLRITAVSLVTSLPADNGALFTIAPDAKSLRYTPPAGFIGTQTLRYTITDGKGGVSSALAVITVSPLALPPAALPDVFTLLVGADETTLDVLANDVDGAGGGLSVSQASSVATVPLGNAGSLSVVDGALRYAPRPGFTGVETLSYTLQDANGATATAAVVITVLPLAPPPVALPDVALLAMDTGTDIDVLANDVDLAGGGLTLTAVEVLTSLPPGGEGSFTVVNNRVRYLPSSASFVGTQSASYTVTDQNGATGIGLLTVVVTPAIPSVPPVAVPDLVTLSSGSTSADLSVLGNDIDVAGGGLSISAASVVIGLPDSSGVSVSTNGNSLQLALPATYAGVLTLSYTITDSSGATASTVALVTVAPAALPTVGPVAVPDVYALASGTTTVSLDVLLNDINVSGGALTVTGATLGLGLPDSSGVSLGSTASGLQLTLPPGYAGVLTLSYDIVDGNGNSSSTAVAVTVAPAALSGIPPLALPDVATLSSGGTSANLVVLGNDIDVAGGGLTISAASVLVGLPDSSGVSVSSNGSSLQLALPATYVGVLTLSYTITDSNGATDSAAVIVTVAPAALPTVPPVPLPDLATVAQDSGATLIDVAGNDIDPAAGGLTLTAVDALVSLPLASHAFAIVGNQLQVIPAAGFAGVVTASYTVTDANGATAVGLLTLTVTPTLVIPLPLAIDDVDSLLVSLLTGSSSLFDVLGNDIDPAGGGLILQSVSFQNPLLVTLGSVLAIVGNQVQLTVPLLGLIPGVLPIDYVAVDSLGRTVTGVLSVTLAP